MISARKNHSKNEKNEKNWNFFFVGASYLMPEERGIPKISVCPH
jgi:hypothetical protein